MNIEDNHIKDLSPLSGLVNLTNLNIEDNQISDLSPLSGLKKLNYLHTDHNPISDLACVSDVEYVSGRPIKYSEAIAVLTETIKAGSCSEKTVKGLQSAVRWLEKFDEEHDDEP